MRHASKQINACTLRPFITQHDQSINQSNNQQTSNHTICFFPHSPTPISTRTATGTEGTARGNQRHTAHEATAQCSLYIAQQYTAISIKLQYYVQVAGDFQEIPVKKKIESKTALTRASSEQPSGWPTAVALVDPVVAFSRDLCADSAYGRPASFALSWMVPEEHRSQLANPSRDIIYLVNHRGLITKSGVKLRFICPLPPDAGNGFSSIKLLLTPMESLADIGRLTTDRCT
ncbi:unnamed protein product [Fusarium graminearum]|uniref:Uncharacterized protein n=1 Tax=Gibberella zeae TaxID=5518 RepID=A0A4E9DM34_GIBZA|nr:unnamed protein product [Fusarium graminearum]CAF3489369.1 unnamed protein product [Fusarium graminearum]CAG1982813.1 unnamed protein product [Fusarium graminearum]